MALRRRKAWGTFTHDGHLLDVWFIRAPARIHANEWNEDVTDRRYHMTVRRIKITEVPTPKKRRGK